MRFCDECNMDRNTKEVQDTQEYTINGKRFPVKLTLLVCDVCGSEVSDEDYSAVQMKTIRETYARLFGMTAEEIRSVRAQYNGLGSRPFAKLLGIGSASLTRHETGDVPSERHLEIYRELKNDPSRIWHYFTENKDALTPRELKKTEAILTEWESGKSGIVAQDDEEIIEAIHKPFGSTEMSGYVPFNLEKFIHMVLYFTRTGVNKTKLMKLLWYADFTKFKRQSVSMSGAAYTRLPFGPVPKDHDMILAHLQHMDVIDIEETILNDEGWVMMSIKARQEFNPELFNPDELAVLEEVESKFLEYGSRRISDYAHEELAWIETEPEKPISYKYAAELRGF